MHTLTFRLAPASGFLLAVLVACAPACAPRKVEPKAAAAMPARTAAAKRVQETNDAIEELTGRALKSIVVISHYGRDGQADGIGAGFIIDPDGLIATSLHVIGEARPIAVHLPDGTKRDVVEVTAWDRKSDLAILRIDAKGLLALPLADSDSLKQGTTVLALGNPQGLDHSVVRGVVSARRDIEGTEMFQIAIPIEPGNSGGPLIDLQGNVHGVLTLKSAVTANLGFAMPINLLKPLMEKPNPVPIQKWLTIGALNERDWKPLTGARWTQRAGRIKVDGFGKGFGGRSLCLWQQPVPEPPYELAVTVKLDDEAGAAGLVFGSDGDDRHYGFYPSAGQLRLTRFEGPDVFSWQVLEQVSCKSYRAGDWNTLKVRVEKDKVLCYVNDELTAESDHGNFAGTQVGLAKFRNTTAEFKIFQVGAKVGVGAIPGELARSLATQINGLDAAPTEKLVTTLQQNPTASQSLLIDRARKLEQQARQLRKLADSVHQKGVETEMMKLFEQAEEDIDLAHAALLVAKLDNDELDISTYRRQIDQMVTELKAKLSANATPRQKLDALKNYLFKECGFHGSRTDYYNRSNSYLNEVIDDREGLPITLGVLFVELAQRIGLTEVSAASTPGHMLVKFAPDGEALQLIDVFDGGKLIGRADAAELVESFTGGRMREEHLRSATKRELVTRILRNLMAVAERSESPESGLRYLNVIVAISPDSALERFSRGMIRLRSGDTAGAREDFKWLLDTAPPGLDLDRVAELYRSL